MCSLALGVGGTFYGNTLMIGGGLAQLQQLCTKGPLTVVSSELTLVAAFGRFLRTPTLQASASKLERSRVQRFTDSKGFSTTQHVRLRALERNREVHARSREKLLAVLS